METKKMKGEYIFTIDENKERGIEKCNIPICEFDCGLSQFNVDIIIYGEDIYKHFSKFNQLFNKLAIKADVSIDCTFSHKDGIVVAEMKNAVIIGYNNDPNTNIEAIILRCDYVSGLNDKTKESLAVAEVVRDANKKLQEEAKKWII